MFKRSSNTWEPEEHLDCSALLKEFEAEQDKSKKATVKTKRKNNDATETTTTPATNTNKVKETSVSKKKKNEETNGVKLETQKQKQNRMSIDQSDDENVKQKQVEPSGFDRNLEPEKILGATNANGELVFLMKWKDSDLADLVESKVANKKCPDVVIAFYEVKNSYHCKKKVR